VQLTTDECSVARITLSAYGIEILPGPGVALR
jgi:hypothetical protein